MPKEKAFFGLPISYQNLLIYPPTVRDAIELPDFYNYLRVLTTSQDNLIDFYWEEHQEIPFSYQENIPTPFEYFLGLYLTNAEARRIIEDGILLFTKESIVLDIKTLSFIIGERSKELTGETGFLVLTDENFLSFQNTLLAAVGAPPNKETDMTRHPHFLEREARSRNRDRVVGRRKGLAISFHSLITSLCIANVGVTPFNVKDLTYAAVHDLKNRIQQKEEYDRSISIMVSGFAPKDFKPPSYWMGDIKEDS